MQKHFPSVGSYFRIGALPPAVAQVFVRSVANKTEVKLPLFCLVWRSLQEIVHQALCYLITGSLVEIWLGASMRT